MIVLVVFLLLLLIDSAISAIFACAYSDPGIIPRRLTDGEYSELLLHVLDCFDCIDS